MLHQTQIRYLLKYILVLIVISNFFISDLYSSKITKPKLNIDMTLEAPDSIIIGEPFKVRLSFIVKDSVIHLRGKPDIADIILPSGCEVLSGSITWRGMLHRGSEVTMEVEAVLKNGKVGTALIGTVSTGFREDFSRTSKKIVKTNIKIIGGEEYNSIDVQDTMKLTEEEKNKLLKEAIVDDREGLIPPLLTFILSDAKKTNKSYLHNLGEIKFHKRYRFSNDFIFQKTADSNILNINTWSIDCNDIVLISGNGGLCQLIVDPPKSLISLPFEDTCNLVIEIDSIKYNLKIVPQD